MTVVKGIGTALPILGQVLGGGGGQQQVQYAQQGVDPYAQQYADQYANQQAQAAYDAQVRAQQAYEAQVRAQQEAMYIPTGYGQPSMAYAQPASMNTSYGDLRSPYTAITEDGQQVQVDPTTGEVIQESMITTPILIGGGALILLLGWYVMSDK